MSHLKQQLNHLGDAYLENMFQLIERTVQTNSPQGSSLGPMLQYHMQTGGKRLRALLPLALAEVLDHDPAQLIPFGAACEILHNATLVHDDLQDGDTVRRGQATVWVEYGEARAINLGDAMLYYTLLLVDALDVPVSTKYMIQQRFLRETLRVIDGQEREFLLKELDAPTLEDYVLMVEGKTSGLFSLPLAGAAALCQAPEDLISALEEASRHLGVVFQIQDDLLDIYGDKGRDQRGTDIAEGKISMLVVNALNLATPQEAADLLSLLGREREAVSPQEIEDTIKLFERLGAVDATVAEMDRRIAQALDHSTWHNYPKVQHFLRQMADVFLMTLPPHLRSAT